MENFWYVYFIRIQKQKTKGKKMKWQNFDKKRNAKKKKEIKKESKKTNDN